MTKSNDCLLAGRICDFSIDLKAKENVMIQLIGFNGVQLVRELVEEARRRDACPFVRIEDPEINRLMIETGDVQLWKTITDVEGLPVMKEMDAYVGIRAAENIYELSQASAAAHKSYATQYLHPVHFKERVNNTKWCVLRYPSPAFAMNARLPTRSFEKFFYAACLIDYVRLRKAMRPLEARLRNASEIRLAGFGTDITLSVKGQNWIPCFGQRNIPDGELFSSPILDSVNGEITYAASVYQGKPFEFVTLKVEDGIVRDFDSSDNDALQSILDTDEGARRFGEFSFGLNPIIEGPMYDILFDEKIYGSNHLTLGQDYEDAPNGNTSNVHWDLVCIGPDVYLDGELIREGRRFVTHDLEVLNPDHFRPSVDTGID